MPSRKAPPPDPLIGQSSQAMADVAREQLNFTRQMYADTADDRERASDIAFREGESQIALANQQRQQNQESRDRYNTTFRPLEDAQVKEAQEYDTPERREQTAGQVMEGVGSQFGNARLSLARSAGANGGNPNSGNYLATLGNLSLREAATKAAAGNTERNRIEAVGDAKMNDAIALGRGVVTQGANAAQLSLAAGNSGVGNAQQPLNIAGQGAAMMNQGFAGAQQGFSGAGNLALGQFQTQSQNARQGGSGLAGALGGIAGQFAGSSAGSTALASLLPFSDKNMKKDIKRVPDKDATNMIRKMPVSSWKYKQGAGDEGNHVGPMAQDAHKAGGNALAPNGKKLDLITANGITLAAARDLDKRLQRVEKHMKDKK